MEKFDSVLESELELAEDNNDTLKSSDRLNEPKASLRQRKTM